MENKAYLHLYPMKSILRLFLFKPGQISVFVLMHVSVYGQRSYGDKFHELSASVQHYAHKNNMILPRGVMSFINWIVSFCGPINRIYFGL